MVHQQDNRSVLQQIAGYWDQRAQGYALQVDAEFEKQLEKTYLPWFKDVPSGGKVLDVGCGPGFFSVALARAGFDVSACDASAEMLAKARERAQSCSMTVETVLGDAQRLTFEDRSFDCVCSRNLVWNLQSPQAAYREWLRVLKPGGVLLVFDGNHYRYLFDERYARVHQDWLNRSQHQMLGVDASVMERIAANLPLGRVMRPQWDEETLEALGARVSSTVLKALTDPLTGEMLVTDFVIKALKAEPNEE